MTTDGFICYAKRKSVPVNSGLWSSGVGENIHPEKDADVANPGVPDPYRTVVCGIAEEFSREISKLLAHDDVVFLGVTFDLDEMNPALLFLARIPLSLQETLIKCKDFPGKDFREADHRWLPGDAEAIEWTAALSDKGWEPMGKAAVIRALEFLRY